MSTNRSSLLTPVAESLSVALLVSVALATVAAAPRPASCREPARHAARPAAAPHADQHRLARAYGRLPLAFEANRGQADPRARYLARGPGYTLALTPTGAVLSLQSAKGKAQRARKAGLSSVGRRGACDALRPDTQHPTPKAVVRVQLVGGNPHAEVAGDEPLPGKSNYFIGNDPKKWRTNVPQYARVRCKNVYPGIDLVYYGNQQQLEYDFVVAPGGDPSRICLAFDGASRISVGFHGDLVLHTAVGEVRQHKPRIYQDVDGERRPVQGGYVLFRPHTPTHRAQRAPSHTPTQVRLALATHDPTRPLVIDPQLVYSTYLGGSGFPDRWSAGDQAFGVAVDGSGNVYVAGLTTSADFPTSHPLQGARNGDWDAFVAKLDPTGSALLYSTYLGGSATFTENSDLATCITVDAAGSAYVAGETHCTDFPVVNALQPAFAGGPNDAFLAKLSPDGSALVYSTYLGGNGADSVFGIAVDSAGSAYVAGATHSTDFPTANPLQPAFGGSTSDLQLFDAFVAKINPSGSALTYSTYLGGSGNDRAYGIAVDAAGNAYVAGETSSTDFPTANALQPTFGGGGGIQGDAFVAKLNATGSALVYSTYLGGSDVDIAQSIAVDAAGNAYVAGQTLSTDFPTANALQPTKDGDINAFISKLNPSGSTLVYSTYLGRGGTEGAGAFAIAVDGAGNAHIAGATDSPTFPLVDAFQTIFGGVFDVFVAELNPAGSALVYSTYLGGNGDDLNLGGLAVAVDAAGNTYIAGGTRSTDFPTANPYQATLRGKENAFIAKIGAAGPPPTFTISGTVRAGQQGLPGVSVTAGGQSVLTDANGAYAISGLSAGTYTVTPSLAEYTFNPASATVTVGPSRSGVNFTAARNTYTLSGMVRFGNAGLPGVTVSAGGQSATTGASGAYQIAGLISGTYTVTPSLAEYTFSPASRAVTLGPSQSGVDFSATRVTYTISGTVWLANVGLPGVTVAAGAQSAVTDAKGQYQISGLVSGDYTVTPSLAEYTFSPSSRDVTLGPSQSGVDFTAAHTTYTISGTVREGASGLAGVTVTTGGQSAVTDGAGRYQISGLVSGSYTVVPDLAEYTFAPPSAAVTLGPSRSGVDFAATRVTYSISGTARVGNAGLPGVTISAGGKSASTDGNGAYQLAGLISGSYTVTPALAEYTFAPPAHSVTLGPNQSRVDFTATRTTYSVSGTVREKFKPLAGATVTLDGQTVITGSSGTYQFSGLISGNYTVSVSKHEYTFVPSSRSVTLGPSQSGIDFSGLPSLPAPPSNLTAVAPSAASVLLTWSDNSDNESGFKVERANPPDGAVGAFTQIAILPANTTSYVDATVSGSASYMYRVRAYNGGGDSAPSNVARVTLPVGVLSVTPSPDAVKGGGLVKGTVTLTGPAPAGAHVALSVSNPRFAVVKPGNVTVEKGKRKSFFTVSTKPVIAATPVTISASYHGSTASAVLLINP